MNMKMTRSKEKTLTAAGCGVGIFLVAYGMIQKNNLLFVLGIATVIASYLVIRRKLKAALSEKNSLASSPRR